MTADRTSDAHTERRGAGRPPIHGAQSRRVQVERAHELAEWVLQQPHANDLDWAAASEIGRLLAMAEALDADLASRGVTTGSGAVRGAATLRLAVSKAILSWCNALGMTPRARAEIVASLREVSAPSFGESYAKRLAELRSGNRQEGEDG